MGVMDIRRRMMADAPQLYTATGAAATFNTNMSAPLALCKAEFMPVQEGTGDPAPDNIRPITGWTGLDVIRGGKSIVPFVVSSKSIPLSGSAYNGSSGWCTAWKAFENRSAKYCYSVYIDNSDAIEKSGARVWFRNKNNSAYVDGTNTSGNMISAGSSGWSTVVIDLSSKTNTYYLDFGLFLRPGATASNPMVEIGNSSTDYEAYKTPTTFPISWASQGTIYGGWVDPVSGELWKTHEIIHLSAAGLASGTDYKFWYTSGIQILDSVNDGVVCNRCQQIANVSGKENSDCITWYTNGIIRWTEIGTYNMTKGEYNAYLTENPITATYKLATPVLIATLTPQQIKTLVGNNTIWSSANGNMTVKYWKY